MPAQNEKLSQFNAIKKSNFRFFGNEEFSARTLGEAFFGFWPPQDIFHLLIGAEGGSELFLGTLYRHLYLEHYETDRLGLSGICRIGKSPRGDLTLVQELNIHRADKRNRGEGRVIFQRQLEACRELGIRRIVMIGRRNRVEWGYYALPRFGFDAFLPQEIRERIPPQLREATTLSELFQAAEGREWWRANGRTMHVPFVYQVDRDQNQF